MQRYARREPFEYRLLWSSEVYKSLSLMASPKVPAAKLAAVRAALVSMSEDPEGRSILQAGAQLLKNRDALGFVASSDREYDDYRAFYKKTLVRTVRLPATVTSLPGAMPRWPFRPTLSGWPMSFTT